MYPKNLIAFPYNLDFNKAYTLYEFVLILMYTNYYYCWTCVSARVCRSVAAFLAY
jgi:hypothetical protein